MFTFIWVEGVKQKFFWYSPIFFYFTIFYLFTFHHFIRLFYIFSAPSPLSFSNEYKTVSVDLIVPIYHLYNIIYLILPRGNAQRYPEEMPEGNARRKCPEEMPGGNARSFFSFPSRHLLACLEENWYVNPPSPSKL